MKIKYIAALICCIVLINLYIFHLQKIPKDSKVSIVCTTSIIAQTIKELVGSWATVTPLMQPGIDPHLYHARTGDVLKLERADVIVYHGLDLEGKMATILQKLSSEHVRVCQATKGINKSLLRAPSYQDVYDPHVWFDVTLWKDVAHYISVFLQDAYPLHAAEISERLYDFLARLDMLDKWIFEQISMIDTDRRVLVTAHDAFAYFGSRYGLHVEALQGVSTDADVSLADINRLSKIIVTHRLPVIFVEQTVSEKYIRGVCERVLQNGHTVQLGETLFSDSLGEAGSDGETYIDMVQHNVRAIVQGLCGSKGI